jgi:acyl carrier protein
MTRAEAYGLIREALEEVSPAAAAKLSEECHLVKDGLVDSLDGMNFLFELEQRLDFKLKAIDEDFDDFRVSRLIDIVVEEAR